MHSGLVENINSFYFSDYRDSNSILLSYCLKQRPQVVLLTVQYQKRSGVPPTVETVQKIVGLGIPVVMFWFDPHADFISDLLGRYCHSATLNVLFGASSNSHKGISLDGSNFVYAGLTFEEHLFDLPNHVRDVPVAFLGSLFPDRNSYVERLRAKGISVYADCGILVNGERSETVADGITPIWKPYSIYLELLSRAQVALDFTSLPNLKAQMRGRVWEALWCKTFLLEENNPVTSLYFAPGVDYVPFDGFEDLVGKVSYYLSHEGERNRIRLHGRATVEKYYNVKLFWGNLLETVSVLMSLGTTRRCSGEFWNIQYYEDHGVT
jgi:hypothetical protein